jgi:NAD(P)-dependent dehydrogenase (short-subunit alcohol dehydrogenase family)
MSTITQNNLERQRAPVTGGTSGIGRAVALQLARDGAAPFVLVGAIAPGVVARGRGSIVSVSSMSGGVGLVGGAAYGATVAGDQDRRLGARVGFVASRSPQGGST